MTPKETALLLAKALDSKKGKDIKVLETGHLTTLADYFVLCSATSSTQIRALSDACEKAMKEEAGENAHHVEGHRGGTWVLLDFSAVVVHIFNEEAREFYDLERLWSDATPVDLTGVLTEDGPKTV
jgi:ribosome-associated protein